MELSPILLCLLAAVPVLLLIILLVGCKWSVGRAAVVSVVVDAVIALSAFGAHPLQILVSAAKGAWSSLSIILIICPAILMYNIVREAGAFRVIRAGIQQATPNKLLQILIIGYAFAAFLQGITGFGVPVAICAPLLIEIGVSPLWALAIAPLGEAWGNTFGTLSAAWDALAAQAGLNEAMPLYWQSALWTAALLFAMNLVSGLLVCWFYGRGAALRRGLPAVLVLSLVQGGGELLMSQVNTTLCCFIPCCLALVVSLLLGRLPLYNTPWELENSRAMEPSRGTLLSEQAPQGMGILHAFSPYLVMTAFSLVCLLIPSVKRVLAGVSVSLSIPAITSGGVEVTEAIAGFSPLSLTNAGVFLFLAAGFGFFYFRRRGWLQAGSGRRILRDSLKKAWPSSVSVIRVSGNLRSVAGVHFYEDLIIYQLLSSGVENEKSAELYTLSIRSLVEYDKQNATNMVETLDCYFACNCNVSETAKALFIHRNTLIYRIDKIKSILGRDLKDSEERLLLQLGLRVYQVRQIREAAANS